MIIARIREIAEIQQTCRERVIMDPCEIIYQFTEYARINNRK